MIGDKSWKFLEDCGIVGDCAYYWLREGNRHFIAPVKGTAYSCAEFLFVRDDDGRLRVYVQTHEVTPRVPVADATKWKSICTQIVGMALAIFFCTTVTCGIIIVNKYGGLLSEDPRPEAATFKVCTVISAIITFFIGFTFLVLIDPNPDRD